MSRQGGFSRADVDSSMLEDTKFRRLWRETRDHALMSEAVVVYLATLLRSWRDGEQIAAEDALPLWMAPNSDAIDALVRVGLFDKDHSIPKRSFASWYGPASERRRRWQEAGKEGADRRWNTKPTPGSTNAFSSTHIAEQYSTGKPHHYPNGDPIATPMGTPMATPMGTLVPDDDPNDAKLIHDLRRFAQSKDDVIAAHARERLGRMGLEP